MSWCRYDTDGRLNVIEIPGRSSVKNSLLHSSFLRYEVGKRITFLEFRFQAVEELLFYKYENVASRQNNPGRPPIVDNPDRLSE
ncbi:hypothetical protein TNCV_1184211 [Trichonephila clavipes]|nr:hypothetical protein TNCV_1184211 [Trichonephila clavipes]